MDIIYYSATVFLLLFMLLATYDEIQREGLVTVPRLFRDAADTARLAKVKFGTGNDPVFNHLAPDPMLLLVKAAVVASAQIGKRLLPSRPPPIEDWTEEDELMAELYLARQRAREILPAEIQTFVQSDCESEI